MRLLRLLPAFFKFNVQQILAYRTDATLSLVLNLVWLGWELVSLQIIFNNTSNLSGWSMGDLVALLGVWRLANFLMSSLIWPNTDRFNTAVRTGAFDYDLLQPVSSQFLVSFSRITVWRVWELLIAVILISVGVSMSGRGVSLAGLLSFLVLVLSGLAVLYSLWIVLIAFTFWFVKFDNNVTILQALMEAGRYPATIYPSWLRFVVTFVIPIAVATTVPLQGLRGELTWAQVLGFIAIGAVSMALSSLVWRSGVKRYSGASS